jgi:peroxiredoxin
MEMPALERLAQSFSKKGLVVLGINLDHLSKRKEVEQFVRNYDLSFPIALDSSFTVPRRYGVTGFPESFFIDREGRLLEVSDPLKKQSTVRFISDRPWDSPVYTEVISELLLRQ